MYGPRNPCVLPLPADGYVTQTSFFNVEVVLAASRLGKPRH
jgi:hypothetical protein